MSQSSHPVGTRKLFGDFVTHPASAADSEPQQCDNCEESFQTCELIISHCPEGMRCDVSLCVQCFEPWLVNNDYNCPSCDIPIRYTGKRKIGNAIELIVSFHFFQQLELISPVIQQNSGKVIIDNFWKKELVDYMGFDHKIRLVDCQCLTLMAAFIDTAQKLANDNSLLHNPVRVADQANQEFDSIQASLHSNKIDLDEAITQLMELMHARQAFSLHVLKSALTWIFDRAFKRTLEEAKDDRMNGKALNKFSGIYTTCKIAALKPLEPSQSTVNDSTVNASDGTSSSTTAC